MIGQKDVLYPKLNFQHHLLSGTLFLKVCYLMLSLKFSIGFFTVVHEITTTTLKFTTSLLVFVKFKLRLFTLLLLWLFNSLTMIKVFSEYFFIFSRSQFSNVGFILFPMFVKSLKRFKSGKNSWWGRKRSTLFGSVGCNEIETKWNIKNVLL